ncbi:MAG: NADH-quinone oxidoreductase subunit M [Chitinophagaceae bacterium]|nr:NADH-quinone oxidoreductase subunit M [Chitinophagaceae bacterium]
MVPVLLILIPLVCGAVSFFIKSEGAVKTGALLSSIATLVVTLLGLTVLTSDSSIRAEADWMPLLGSSFSVAIDGMGKILCLLTAIAFPVIFISTHNSKYSNPHNFYALMLLSQAGLMGVFVAYDALLFYFFWELALIPTYFLCSQWGGERRIPVTFKFFIYTFVGSLFMLVGIIYLYSRTPDRSFALESFYNLSLTNPEQMWLFWIMFIAFAVKMPVFPFHTWQPDTYEQSPTAVTMVLSGIMVKMGVFGVLRWLVPVVPLGSWAWGDTVSTMAIIGMIYASLIAMRQDDLKRLIAYSSIAHIGLMCLAIFATNSMSMQGVMIQMFNHGINIIGLWIVVELIERQFKTRKMSELGGLAQKAPAMSVLLVILALANVALPLTNAFVGEFLMFAGVFNSEVTEYSKVYTVASAVTIILSAVYTLNMLQKVLFGNTSAVTAMGRDIRRNEKIILGVLVLMILFVGIYPKPMLDLTQETVDMIISKMINKHPL